MQACSVTGWERITGVGPNETEDISELIVRLMKPIASPRSAKVGFDTEFISAAEYKHCCAVYDASYPTSQLHER